MEIKQKQKQNRNHEITKDCDKTRREDGFALGMPFSRSVSRNTKEQRGTEENQSSLSDTKTLQPERSPAFKVAKILKLNK